MSETVNIVFEQNGKKAILTFSLDEESTATLNTVFEPDIGNESDGLYLQLWSDFIQILKRGK